MIVTFSEILRGAPNTSNELLRLGIVFVVLHNALDPMLIIYFDNKLKREFLDLFSRLKIRRTQTLLLSPVKHESAPRGNDAPTLKLDRNRLSVIGPSPPTRPYFNYGTSSVIESTVDHGSHAKRGSL